MNDLTYYGRVKTAPLFRDSYESEFKNSKLYILLERAITSLSMFITNDDFQFDIESHEGQSACKTFLKTIEELIQYFGI